jgi:hypothetical protein
MRRPTADQPVFVAPLNNARRLPAGLVRQALGSPCGGVSQAAMDRETGSGGFAAHSQTPSISVGAR